MKKLAFLSVLCLIALGFMSAQPEPAQCAFCYSGTCYNSSICGNKCVCLKKGLDVDGSCYSFSSRPEGNFHE